LLSVGRFEVTPFSSFILSHFRDNPSQFYFESKKDVVQNNF